jgi:Uma2 family endonuclease
MTSIEVLEPETALPVAEDDPLYEIVDDQRVELLPMAANAVQIAFNLAFEIKAFAKSHDLGQASTEMLFRLRSKPKLHRRPDAAYVSFERWPKGQRIPKDNAWDVIPDLVVEVVSPNDYAVEILVKIREYFEAGVRRVWLIYIDEALVYEYDSPRSIRVLGREDVLEGGSVIPDFRLPLSELLEAPEEKKAS